MSPRVRRTVACGAIVSGLAFATPLIAWADDYPPPTPSPTVSGVKVANTPTSSSPAAADVAGSSAAALPRTGTDVAVWTLGGGALLIGGSALVLASRRRRTCRSH